MLGEPTNDLDTDMLAAMEDLLDSWPGTLIVVSHDRYFLERVTDQQFAILGHRLRHLPGGVDEYLRLRQAEDRAREAAGAAPASAAPATAAGTVAQGVTLSGAERRAAEKDLQSIERRLAKLAGEIASVHASMAEHDQNDYTGLAALGDRARELEGEVAELEERWLEVSELLG